jgi:iron complex transport system substrate-binding protein
MRIVSLFPGATEMIHALRLGEQLVGVSHECDFPPIVQNLPAVTRTRLAKGERSAEIDRQVRENARANQALYSLDIPKLVELRPDIIVTQTLCGVCAVSDEAVQSAVSALARKPRMITCSLRRMAHVFHAMLEIGHAAGVADKAGEVVKRLQARVTSVAERASSLTFRPRMTLLEWLDPPFSCGHWNPELVRLAGGVEGLGQEGQPSRTLRWDEVISWRPEIIVIACCGYRAEQALADTATLQSVPGWSDLPAVRSNRVYVTDGAAYFNRPGPRLVDSLEVLAHLISPETIAKPDSLLSPIRLTSYFATNETRGVADAVLTTSSNDRFTAARAVRA